MVTAMPTGAGGVLDGMFPARNGRALQRAQTSCLSGARYNARIGRIVRASWLRDDALR